MGLHIPKDASANDNQRRGAWAEGPGVTPEGEEDAMRRLKGAGIIIAAVAVFLVVLIPWAVIACRPAAAPNVSVPTATALASPTPVRPMATAPPASGGSGRAAPIGRDCPQGYPIKGNISRRGERIYHVPGGQFYDRTVPEVCFATEADARAAGFRRSLR